MIKIPTPAALTPTLATAALCAALIAAPAGAAVHQRQHTHDHRKPATLTYEAKRPALHVTLTRRGRGAIAGTSSGTAVVDFPDRRHLAIRCRRRRPAAPRTRS